MNIPSAKIEKFVGDDEQPIMKHAWLDVEGKRLLATNGHMATRLSISVGEDDVSGLVPIEAFELARKELKLIAKAVKNTIPDPWLQVICNPDTVFIKNLMTNTTHMVLRPKLEPNQKFPNVDAVFPTLSKPASITLSVGYLMDIMSSIEPDIVGVSFWLDDAEKCATIAAPGGQANVVLMPMHGDTDPKEVMQRGKPTIANMADVLAKAAEFVNAGGLDKDGCTVTATVYPSDGATARAAVETSET